ncbi:MAG TPA: glutaredoxin family protein [Thermoleophilia bacterium]|jgi:glutaredoxin|nr:glutaredoxin family protein [Acidobacteriota bacterium]OPZ44996.1 MAG: Glutaredoxin [Actinobacteria bacterium ADurb.BinA094]HOU28311.1 glutaredoxin family protein [Thermoleophilia bacterium]HQF52759.1 glutaredoxin family protein [Thermoleophilia bacterium]HQH21387.1 glutaredoxin family protein [Thermoleophilia bacterium]
MIDEVFVYALSTCPWCRKTKQWFDDSRIEYEAVDVDKLSGDEQDAAADKAYELSGGRRFPVVVINGEVVVGYNPDKFLQHLRSWGGGG